MTAKSLRAYMNAAIGALALLLSIAAPSASAATSVAIADTLTSVSYVGTGESIELADKYAMALCNVESRKRGVIPACRVYNHTDSVGWFAVACGQLGCGSSLAQKSLKVAQEAAFDKCFELQKFCNTDLVAFGNDLSMAARKAAPKKPTAPAPAANPESKSVQ